MAKVCYWLGLQDTAWKWHEPSTMPGAWAGGAMIVLDETGMNKLVTDMRWKKNSTEDGLVCILSWLGSKEGQPGSACKGTEGLSI
jgi:hypothetical protein